MSRPRLRVWSLRIAAGLGGLLLLAWLLRWPLFGGIVRAEIRAALAEHLQGELREVRLSGGLLSSVQAEDLIVEGGPEAPYREIRVRRARVRYGFLGGGPLDIHLEGLRAEIVDREPEKPPDKLKTVREAEKIVRRFAFPGRLRVEDAEILLPDGLRITVAEAAADETRLRARGRVPGFGEIDALREGSTTVATATEGPVRRVRLERDGEQVRFTALIEGHEVQGSGRLVLGPDGALLRAAGDASAPLGRATLAADFTTGRVSGLGEIAFELEDPVRARVTVAGTVAGPLMGPLEAWTLTDATARAPRAAWRDLELEDVRVEIPDATLEAVTWSASARRGPDRIEARGRVRDRVVEGLVEARIQDIAPYVPELKARDVGIVGRFQADGGFGFQGRVESGPGEIAGVAWTSLAADVAAGPQGVEVPSLRIQGLPLAPEAAVTGTVDILDGPRYAVRAAARSGEDRLALEGVLDRGRFDGRFSGNATLEGIRARAAGRVSRDEEATRFLLDPGEVEGVHHGPLDIRLFDGRVVVEETDVALADPPVKARVSGTLRWTEEGAAGEARAREIAWKGKPLGALAGTFRSAAKGVELDAAWAAEAGIGAELRGRWGEDVDLRLQARVPDLSAPWVRRLLEGAPVLKGAARLDLRLGGSAAAPEPSGTLAILGAGVENAPPLSLAIPFRSEGRRVALTLKDEATPYGRLWLDVRLPLPGAEEPLEARARFEARDLPAFAPFLPEEIRPHLPAGRLELEASAQGQDWTVRGTLSVPEARLPEPFPPLKDVVARATLDAGGLRSEGIRGWLGGGSFEASLRRESAGPFRGSLRGRELLAVATRLSHIRVSPEVEFSWQEGRGLLRGKVAVPIALIHEEPGTAGAGGGGDLAVGGLRLRPAPGGGVAVPGVAGFDALGLDLEVETTGEVRVENSILGALLKGKGRLRGTLAAPAASGVVEARSGEVKLPAAIFVRIEEARVTIPPEVGADPSVHFVGRVGRGDDAIEIRVDGPLARPELRLASHPPATQEALMARLAFGHPPGQVEGAALGAFAFRLFEQVTAGWPQAEPSEGVLSRLKPTVTTEEGETAPRRPWELPSGRTARGMVVRTEYLWTPYFSIVGEADREANVGGDIKLRLRFR